MYPVEQFNYLLALGTLGLQVLVAAFLALFFLQKTFLDLRDVGGFLARWGLWIAFALSLGSVVLTLYYSEILGFVPCGWCWMQRVFLYPQPILFAIALWKCRTSDVLHIKRDVADYSIGLSAFGFAAALYQHYLQMGGTSVLPCPASGAGDCSQRFLFEFGYVTFPLMAATLFAFLIVSMLFVRKR